MQTSSGVKVYARFRGASIRFYKDGYSDLLGRFDYATLSTDELDRVERFSILVLDDARGGSLHQASPPMR